MYQDLNSVLVCCKCFIMFDAIATLQKKKNVLTTGINFFSGTVKFFLILVRQKNKFWTVCQSVCSHPQLHPIMSSSLIPQFKS